MQTVTTPKQLVALHETLVDTIKLQQVPGKVLILTCTFTEKPASLKTSLFPATTTPKDSLANKGYFTVHDPRNLGSGITHYSN